MLEFWAVVAVIIIICLVFLIPPLLKNRSTGKTVARKDLTITVYKDQFAELENDLKNNVISQEQYDSAKVDLEKNLLDDVKKAATQDEEHVSTTSPLLGRITAAVVAIVIPVSSVLLYNHWGAGIDGIAPQEVSQTERQAKQMRHQQETIEEALTKLEDKLKKDPNDGEGWVMLARTYSFLQRYSDAVKAYEKALPLGGSKSPDVLAGYADSIAMASGRRLTEKSVEELKKALVIDPNHIKSLWLLGTAGYQNKDYKLALENWEKLYTVLPADSQDKQQVAANVNEVRSRLGMPPMAMPEPVQTAQQNAPMSDVSIKGRVSLGSAVASKASPDDTVFIFARAVRGPRMPLAIIRKKVKDMPYDFTLDDSLAMSPALRLSSVPEVVVGARVSKSGNAMPQPGDMQVISGTIEVKDAKPIQLVINDIVK